MLGERSNDEVEVDAGELLRGDAGPRPHQHFEPLPEPSRIKLLVGAGPRRPPQVEVEHRLQLTGCGHRHQIAAVLEATGLDDPVEHLGLQARNHLREMRRVQDACEQSLTVRDAPRGGSA